uniref:Uncharacterized protein n=1 Tax=Oryza glumipatula TaxID=40148 RepID=A0A0D9Y4R4_9ORYZ
MLAVLHYPRGAIYQFGKWVLICVQAAIALSPYLPVTQRRFVVVELAAPQPSPRAIVLHHLPADTVPAAAVVFSWIHRPTQPPTISSTAISSLLMAAARRLLHTSPVGTAMLCA